MIEKCSSSSKKGESQIMEATPHPLSYAKLIILLYASWSLREMVDSKSKGGVLTNWPGEGSDLVLGKINEREQEKVDSMLIKSILMVCSIL